MMPCEPELQVYWARRDGKGRAVTLNGEVLACTFNGKGSATGVGYVPHWATCGRPPARKRDGAEQMRIFEED